MNYTQDIVLDVGNCSIYQTVQAKQGDSGSRFVQIALTRNGMPLTIPAGATARFRCAKPDGNGCDNPATISGNTITAELTEQVLAVPGMVRADVVLTDQEGDVLSSAVFLILVEAAPIGRNVNSSSEILTFMGIINEGQALITALRNAWESGAFKGEKGDTGYSVLTAPESALVSSGHVLPSMVDVPPGYTPKTWDLILLDNGAMYRIIGEETPSDYGTVYKVLNFATMRGTNGKDGYTPVKGTDYYTEADKAEMVEAVGDTYGLDILTSSSVNIFNCNDVTTGYQRNVTVGQSINHIITGSDMFYSNQIWDCKKGDVIRCNIGWAYILVYDASGVMVERWNTGDSDSYTVTSDTAVMFTYQGLQSWQLADAMITLNNDMPGTYVEYVESVSLEQMAKDIDSMKNQKSAFFEKPFVVLSFDTFNLDDNRFNILNEYGYRATVAHRTVDNVEINKTVLKAGWDVGLYKYDNCPAGSDYESAIAENPTEEILAAWDAYVKSAIDEAEEAMVYNPVVWQSRQGCSCYGLETALKKYGIPMCRGSYNPTYSNDWVYSPDELPTMTVAPKQTLMPSTLAECQTAIEEAVANGHGVAFLTHGIYGTDADANANYGITEATLRSFLDTVKGYVDAGQLEVLTYRDIYAKYHPDDARERDYNRLVKMAIHG